jgi:uncharacterized membrane protein
MERKQLSVDQSRKIEEQLARCRNPNLADAIERNIIIVEDLRRQALSSRTTQERIADAITDFAGSMAFVYLHGLWFALWIAANLKLLPGVHPFDPFPFGLLTMIVSLEAIFLSTFVLVSQNRMGKQADQRADLDLQINLLDEHETTRILRLVDAIAKKMGIEEERDYELEQLKEPVAPDVVLQEIESRHAEEEDSSV